jgi:NAD(P)-dependent dehydrogenase (short-subunit alcohol dehydrogenase family)
MGALDGKSILVAGAGGIGGELARRYAREGASVTLGDLDREAAQAVAEEVAAAGGQAQALAFDGADEASVMAGVAQACDRFGGLDGLHCNFASFADNGDDDGVLELAQEAYDETMRVNARGFWLCTRHALPKLLERGGGSILYTSSAGAYRGGRARVAYAMAKSAGHALMRHVAARHGRDGVRANAIAPGAIMHERWEAELPDKFKAWLFDSIPLKARLGRPTDIAALSALLMSEEGAFITGQVISVDGGLTMRA